MRTQYISLFLLGALALSSCDDFLDMQPTSAANAEQAIATPQDAEVSLNGILRTMSGGSYYGRNFIVYGDAKGGDLTIYTQGRGLDNLYSFNHSATNGTYSGFWSEGYSCIMNASNLINNILRIRQESGSEYSSSFDEYLGEAYTLRALIHFDLVRLYGMPYLSPSGPESYGVPYVVEALDATAHPTRDNVSSNYADILSDLTAGEPLLTKKSKNGYPGYYANLALQARVNLYMGNYSAALSAARTIIDSGVYKLYEPSDWVSSWTRQFGSESIFEIIIDNESDLGRSSLGFYYMGYRRVNNAMGWFLASDYFLQRLGEDPTDVRWGVMDADEYEQNHEGQVHHGACYKYSGSTSLSGDGKETSTAVNVKVIRLSEIYLIAAEAALETGDREAAASYLNAIRRRSPGLEPALSTNVSLDMIMDERSKEFFGEGQRFFEMMRRGRSVTFNDDLNDVPVTDRPKTIDWSYGKIVLPISQDEINANPAIASQQNEAYK